MGTNFSVTPCISFISPFRTAANGAEIELPLFPRERLKLTTFLGSGAFGEVFEGLANDIHGPQSGDARVAVKVREIMHSQGHGSIPYV